MVLVMHLLVAPMLKMVLMMEDQEDSDEVETQTVELWPIMVEVVDDYVKQSSSQVLMTDWWMMMQVQLLWKRWWIDGKLLQIDETLVDCLWFGSIAPMKLVFCS